MIDDKTFFMRILFSMIIGGVIGYERQFRNRHAGIRTFALICVSSSVLTMIGLHIISIFNQHDISYFLLGLILSIGFLGSGLIYKEFIKGKNIVFGLTSASVLIITSIQGILIGLGLYIKALILVLVVMFILLILRGIELKLGLKQAFYPEKSEEEKITG